MSETNQTQLLMVKEGLDALPAMSLPEGYRVRSFRSGDEEAWERIIRESFGDPHSFAKHMTEDEAYKPERVWFVCDDGDMPVATASAWFKPEWTADTGYLHMVGILPEHAGRRLGYWVSLAALLQMEREDRTRCVLHTDNFRLPAVKTYLKLGYSPEIVDEGHAERWRGLASVLGKRIEGVDSSGNAVSFG
ncbi:GNAT family N-acetyltransferase [Paenibacillus sacheonensis]|uniref:GNAT family N-acetyltransferase n=1 Tax=Paenibacillus sacheonensis TaxID=742054 RepID=A0A7X4YKI0_9BACL|nr:GNAT family N-acetyltransferase [Paenibacillus sacheonensis]MBM7563440.1 mycothiol synthase [Paenibacillus sacheonensis]NBC68005.1 GNAT family N-acetyltransferase [Paenibacillus sacheonensis]